MRPIVCTPRTVLIAEVVVIANSHRSTPPPGLELPSRNRSPLAEDVADEALHLPDDGVVLVEDGQRWIRRRWWGLSMRQAWIMRTSEAVSLVRC